MLYKITVSGSEREWVVVKYMNQDQVKFLREFNDDLNRIALCSEYPECAPSISVKEDL